MGKSGWLRIINLMPWDQGAVNKHSLHLRAAVQCQDHSVFLNGWTPGRPNLDQHLSSCCHELMMAFTSVHRSQNNIPWCVKVTSGPGTGFYEVLLGTAIPLCVRMESIRRRECGPQDLKYLLSWPFMGRVCRPLNETVGNRVPRLWNEFVTDPRVGCPSRLQSDASHTGLV